MENPNLIKKVEEYVYAHPWGPSAYDFLYLAHVEGVRRYALDLASKLNANKRVVEVAALLHDVGKINDVENHHLESAKIAEKLLKNYGCDETFIGEVKHCILTHRASRKSEPSSLEARIIRDADGLAFLDLDYGGLFVFLYGDWVERKLGFKEGIARLKNKFQRMYNKITTEHGKRLAKPLYEEAKRYFHF